jgi:hypothetical protein
MTLSLARLQELLEYDPETGVFTWKVTKCWRAPAGSEAGTINIHGRRAIMVDQKLYTAHRLAWLYVHGEWPAGEIDHINCDPADNRICNLRLATSSQNKCNSRRPSHNTSGFKGVYYNRRLGRFAAQIAINKTHRWLGLFDTAEAAHAAYCRAANELHGEFARAA